MQRTPLMRSSLDLGMPPSPRSFPRTPYPLNEGISPRSQYAAAVEVARPQVAFVTTPIVPVIEEEIPLARGKSLEVELTNAGYTPLTKMVVVSPEGREGVKYVKAQSDIGTPVYIMVDVDGYIPFLEEDVHFKESRLPMTIEEEEKLLFYEKAGMGVSGVAMECNSGLCTIMHDEKMQPRETNYMLYHSKKMEETTIVATYPLVRMSEIRANPHVLKKHCDHALRKMRNAALCKCIANIEEVKKKVACFCKLFQETLDCKEHVVKEFQRTMNFLEDSYDCCMKCPEKNECKIKDILYNIEKRNAMFPCLMESCKEISALECKIEESIKILHRAHHRLQKKFKYLSCAYERTSYKKHCHKKCAWQMDFDSDDDM